MVERVLPRPPVRGSGEVQSVGAVQNAFEITLFLLLLAGLWQAFVQITGLPPLLLPGPLDVARILVNSWPSLLRNMLVTMEAVGLGFLLGASGGFILAVLMKYSATARRMLLPLAAMLYVIPKAVFVPLFILWWGIGPTYKLLVVALLVFFPVMENTTAGLQAATADMLDLSRSLGGGKAFTFRKVELPSALPFVLAGLRLGVAEAFVGAVLVELIVPFSGIGAQIVEARQRSNTQFILAGISVIALFGIASYRLVERVERRLTFWY